MDDTARAYVRLVLAVGVHDGSYVDAYYGPAEVRTQVEAELQLGKSPVGLHRGARVTFDRQLAVLERLDGQIIDHRMRKDAEQAEQFVR